MVLATSAGSTLAACRAPPGGGQPEMRRAYTASYRRVWQDACALPSGLVGSCTFLLCAPAQATWLANIACFSSMHATRRAQPPPLLR